MRETRIEELSEARLRRRRRSWRSRAHCRRPASFGDLGPIMVIAGGHPGGGVLGAGRRPLALADRRGPARCARPAVRGPVAPGRQRRARHFRRPRGPLATRRARRQGGVRVDEPRRVGRCGVEIDDRFTAYDASAIEAMRFEGGQMLLRIDLEDPATPSMLEACSRAVDELAARGLVAMVQPFMSTRFGGRVQTELTTAAAVKASAISAALGPTSAYTWLKVPVVEEMAAVAGATTLPTVLLGGELREDQDAVFESWRRTLEVANVVGMVVGCSLLYPADDDVAAAVDTVVGLFPSAVAP